MRILSIPLYIASSMMGLGVMLCLTIIGIPFGLMMFLCGLGLAIAALVLIGIPLGLFTIGMLLL